MLFLLGAHFDKLQENKKGFSTCPLGRKECLCSQGLGADLAAGSDWFRGPKTAQGTQAEAGAQELHKGMRCKPHWSSPRRHPQPLPQEFPDALSHMRECHANSSLPVDLSNFDYSNCHFECFLLFLEAFRPLTLAPPLYVVITSLASSWPLPIRSVVPGAALVAGSSSAVSP